MLVNCTWKSEKEASHTSPSLIVLSAADAADVDCWCHCGG